jgi:flagellar motor protein MotB
MRVTLPRVFTVVIVIALPGCTAKYQDLLHDRDQQIRELNGRVADLRAENENLARKGRENESALEGMRTAKPSEASDQSAERRLTNELGPEVEVRYRNGRLSIGIENTVTFDSGSTALKSTAHSVLKKVATALKRDYAGSRYFVEGHTDDDPISKTKEKYRSNRHLSAERADAVATFLTRECGIPERQIVIVGFGEHDPRDGTARSNKAAQRRVEIVVGDRL